MIAVSQSAERRKTMLYIEPKYDKDGNLTHYRLTVSNGLNWKGQQIRRRKTWKPPREGMTPKQPAINLSSG